MNLFETVALDALPATAKSDILDMLLGPNGPKAFEKAWVDYHGVASFNDTYVAQTLFCSENLSNSGNCVEPVMMLGSPEPISVSNISAKDRGVSNSVVSAYAGMSADTSPPILVRKSGDEWVLVEGGHRLMAARMRGSDTIMAYDVSVMFSLSEDEWVDLIA